MKAVYKRALKLTYFFTFLVIFAGSFVRSTGSGMGCPDWPKCFGYLIPPSSPEQLEFKANHAYKAGIMIMHQAHFYTAKSDFTSSSQFEPAHWEIFTEHEYVAYNPRHTYTEYINRLSGALLGVFAFITLVSAFFIGKKEVLFNFIAVIFIGFEAWLGKTVVSSNLSPVKITVHMLFAIFIMVILAFLLERARTGFKNIKAGKYILITIVLLSAQIMMGTQVRELVDHFRELGMGNQIYGNFNIISYIHRSTSILVLISFIVMTFKLHQSKLLTPINHYIWLGFAAILILTFSGAVMWYSNVPMSLGPLHLVLSILLLSFLLRSYFRISK